MAKKQIQKLNLKYDQTHFGTTTPQFNDYVADEANGVDLNATNLQETQDGLGVKINEIIESTNTSLTVNDIYAYDNTIRIIKDVANGQVKIGTKILLDFISNIGDLKEIDFANIVIEGTQSDISQNDQVKLLTIGRVKELFNELNTIANDYEAIYEIIDETLELLPTTEQFNDLYNTIGIEVVTLEDLGTVAVKGEKVFLVPSTPTGDDFDATRKYWTPQPGQAITVITADVAEVASFTTAGWVISNVKDSIKIAINDMWTKINSFDAGKAPAVVQLADGEKKLEVAVKDLDDALKLKSDITFVNSKFADVASTISNIEGRHALLEQNSLNITNNKDVVGGTTFNFSNALGTENKKIATRTTVFDSVKPVYDKVIVNETKIQDIVSTELPAIRGEIISKQAAIDAKADKTEVYSKEETYSVDEIDDIINGVEDDIDQAIRGKADSDTVYTKTQIDSQQRQQDQDRGSLASRLSALEDATAFIEQVYKWNGQSTTTITSPFDLKTLILTDGGKFTFKEGDKLEVAIQQLSSGALVSHPITADTSTTPVQFRWDVNGASHKGLDIDIAPDGMITYTLINGATLTNYRIYEIIKKVEQSSANTYITSAQADAKFQLKDDAAIIVSGYTTDENTTKKINFIDSKVEINKTSLTGKVSKPTAGTAATARFLVGGDGALVSYTVPDVTGQITSATTGLQPKTMVAKPATMTATTVEGAITEIVGTLDTVKLQSNEYHASITTLTPRVTTLESAVKLDDTSLVALETLLGL